MRLRQVVVWHYVMAVLQGLFAIASLALAVAGTMRRGGRIGVQWWLPPDEALGQAVGAWTFWAVAAGALCVVTLAVARRVSARRGWRGCVFGTAINLVFIPWGTILAVYTLLVLSRPEVRREFAAE